MELNQFIGIIALLYALTNPIGVIPIFLGFTRHLQVNNTRPLRPICMASTAVAAFLVFSAVFGEAVLDLFNLGLDEFRIAGGLLALFIAFEMFQAHYGGFMQTSDEKQEAEADIQGIAITPLAFPLLVGPAEMGIMITLSNDMQGIPGRLMLILCAVITSLLIAITLWAAIPINRVLGKTGINVATRVMALIVAAIGIQFILTGIRNQLPGLVS